MLVGREVHQNRLNILRIQALTIAQKRLYVSAYPLSNLGLCHVQGEVQTKENVQKADTRKNSVLILQSN